MASGETLLIFGPQSNQPPCSGNAVFGTRNGQVVLNFPQVVQAAAFFGSVLPRHYSGNGIMVNLIWVASSNSGNAVWGAQTERHQAGVTVLDSDHFLPVSPKEVVSAASAVAGTPQYCSISFTDAELAGLAVGESFRLKIFRDGINPSDTMADVAQLIRVEMKEI